jgi:uncharacterized membrane protein
MKKRYALLIAAATLLLPLIADAQFNLNTTSLMSLRDVVNILIGGINNIVRVLVAGAFVLFLFGFIRMIYTGSDPREREKSKRYMLWGLVVLFIMASLWGILGFLCGNFLSYSCIAG